MERQVVIHRPGGYRRLLLEEHVLPDPGTGEVQIEVHFAGLNFADCLVRKGLYRSARDFVGWPITPGFEVAGQVRSVGRGVSGFQVGDEVLAVTRFGGYATALNIPAELVLNRPEYLSPRDAAALPTVFLTAWYALHELAHPRPGAKVLIHSAAGGVGGALVQLSRRMDCVVTAVVGSRAKKGVAEELGAHQVLVGSGRALWKKLGERVPDGFDVIFDAHGASTLRRGYKHLASPGKLVIYGFHGMLRKKTGRVGWGKILLEWARTPRFDPLRMTHENRSVMAFNLSYLFQHTQLFRRVMTQLFQWLEEGSIRPLPTRIFPLQDVRQAHRALESGETVGKLVLET